MKNFKEYNQLSESAKLVKKSLVIVRGVPGAGKSTFANLLSGGDDEIVCTADDYFMQDGEYKWDATKLGEAHRTCQEKCKKLMEHSARLVIVANTSVRGKDFEPYIDLAERYGYQVFSVIVENRHGNDNVHNVPDDVVDSMKRKFQINL